MKRSFILRWVCAAAVLLCFAFPVAADTTATATTTTMEATTTVTTTEATTTTTEVTTTTAAMTTAVTTAATIGTTTAGTTAKAATITTPTTTAAVAPNTTTAAGAMTNRTTTTTTTAVTTTTTRGIVVDESLTERVVVVSEPDDGDEKIYFYQGDRKMDAEDFIWVEGRTGLALQLNGEDQYLRYSAQKTLQLEEFTFSAWVNWQGGDAGQKLLTVYKNDNRFFTVSPFMQDEEAHLNGMYMEVRDRGIEPDTMYYTASEGSTFALEQNAWHHMAVVISDTEFSLYVDGALYLSTVMDNVSVADMELNTFLIGGGFYGEPRLSALLDDAYLYPQALTADEIALLAAGMDPAYGGTAPTTTVHLPTRPTASTTNTPADGNVPQRGTLFGLPIALVLIPGIILVAVVILSLVLSAQKKREETIDGITDEEVSPIIGETEVPIDTEEEEEQE